MIEKFEVFTIAMSEITSFWAKIATTEMEKYGLKGICAKYFITLLKNPQGMTAARLCEVCYRDKAEVSRAVRALEEKGFLKRDSSTPNGYRAKITLTDEGRNITSEIRERIKLIVENAGSGLSEIERESFYTSLDLISKNLKRISKKEL